MKFEETRYGEITDGRHGTWAIGELANQVGV